jgi:hypothetical protein
MKIIFAVLLLSAAIQAQSFKVGRPMASNLSNAPQPTGAYSSGFGFDNQLYFLQGWGVTTMVAPLTNRPWVGAAAGVGSCMLWRAVHDQGYTNDGMFSSNRVAFCAAGSAAGYVTSKWLFHARRKKIY